MSEKRSFDFVDAQSIIFGTVFTGMATFGLFHAIGNFAMSNSFGNYLFVSLCVLILVVSLGLFISIPKPTALNVVLITGLAAFLVGVTAKKEDIKNWYVDLKYNKVSETIMNGYENVSQSVIYQNFVVDRRNRDIVKLKEYQANIKDYSSISADQMMNLQLFQNSINNYEISAKLNSMFEDKIVTKTEYANFQKFISTVNLNSKERALLSFVTK